MNKKEIKYQSVKIKYPKYLYLIVIWLIRGEKTIPFVLHEAYKDVEDGCKDGDLLIKMLNKGKTKKAVSDVVLIVPLTYGCDIPLKKKYWESPSVDEDPWDRTLEYSRAILKPFLYETLIIPALAKHKGKYRQIFQTATVLLKDTWKDNIESFLLSSKTQVSPEAKNASIYSIEKAYSYKLSTKEILTKEEEIVN